MNVTIHPIPLGVGLTYLLLGEEGRGVLVDAGASGSRKGFPKALERLSVNPERIELVVVTHGHWDHMGCAGFIREMTGARIAMHASEKDRLEKGSPVTPPGATWWGRVFRLLAGLMSALNRVPPTPVDIVVQDEGMSLEPYGVAGKILHTPGHSPGSLSVVLDTGEAFVGDLAMNGPPLRIGPGYPAFAENPDLVEPSWNRVVAAGGRTIFPAHGKPFPADQFRPR
jgi:glyoxylase-like metal-dependent hydrolase (beta-lactamase superfamily II)